MPVIVREALQAQFILTLCSPELQLAFISRWWLTFHCKPLRIQQNQTVQSALLANMDSEHVVATRYSRCIWELAVLLEIINLHTQCLPPAIQCRCMLQECWCRCFPVVPNWTCVTVGRLICVFFVFKSCFHWMSLLSNSVRYHKKITLFAHLITSVSCILFLYL